MIEKPDEHGAPGECPAGSAPPGASPFLAVEEGERPTDLFSPADDTHVLPKIASPPGVRSRATRARRGSASPFLKGPARSRPVDWALLRSLAGFELALCLRGRGWSRLLAGSVLPAFFLAAAPLYWTARYGDTTVPIGHGWTWSVGALLQGLYFAIALTMTRRRLRHELQPGRVDEILLTGAGMREVFLGKALALTAAAALLTVTSLPGLLLLLAPSGHEPATGLRLLVALAPAALLGAAVGLESVLPRGAIGYLQAFALIIVGVIGLAVLSALPPPGSLTGMGVAPAVAAVLSALHAAVTGTARFLLHALHILNPLAASFDAWDPETGHWPARCAALWATVLFVWWRNSRRCDEQDVPGLASTARLLAFRLVEFDPRPFRRWRVGFIWVQDLAFGVPADQIPLSVTADRPVPDFARGNPVAAFDSVFGSRVFIRADYLLMLCLPPAAFWLLGLAGGGIARLGHGSLEAARVWVMLAALSQTAILCARMCYGMAASIAVDHEKGRWPFLCLTPLTDWEILWGKATAVLRAERRLLLGAVLLSPLAMIAGILPLRVGVLLPAMSLLVPAASLFLGGLMAVTAGSLGEASFRCTLALFGPVALLVLLGAVGLPQGWLQLFSPFTAVAFAMTSTGSPAALATAWGALLLSGGVGCASAALTALALRSRLGAGE